MIARGSWVVWTSRRSTAAITEDEGRAKTYPKVERDGWRPHTYTG